MVHQIFDIIGSPILWFVFICLFFIEKKFQLRKRVQQIAKRLIINFIVAIPAFVLLRILLIPEMVWLAIINQKLHFGLNYFLHLLYWLANIAAFVLLDYTNYIWHILNHKFPFLWRFHLVHHTDHDLDVSTAVRFHFGEIIGSVIFRGAAVFLTGASPLVVLIYEIIFEAATQFHHSNWKLPFKPEKILNKIIVTPRMHGIHHSVIRNDTDSNFSVIFSFWDRLHKTIKLNIPQDQIVIGVPSYSNKEELTIGYLLKLPFTRIRKWEHSEQERKFNDTNQLEP
jgi:sterol desaturase/sphingolipid hydroxylase (fatty acid hydroxylase superfamily)